MEKTLLKLLLWNRAVALAGTASALWSCDIQDHPKITVTGMRTLFANRKHDHCGHSAPDGRLLRAGQMQTKQYA
jgi:hypothetical protein